MAADGTGQTEPFDVKADGHQPGAPLVEGLPDDGAETGANRGAGGRAHQEHVAAPQPVVVEPAIVYGTTDASSTTDPHRDQGSAATGHVEDATPDTHAAGPPVEETPAEETPPAHEEPPPPPPPEPHHDEPAATTPDADHTT